MMSVPSCRQFAGKCGSTCTTRPRKRSGHTWQTNVASSCICLCGTAKCHLHSMSRRSIRMVNHYSEQHCLCRQRLASACTTRSPPSCKRTAGRTRHHRGPGHARPPTDHPTQPIPPRVFSKCFTTIQWSESQRLVNISSDMEIPVPSVSGRSSSKRHLPWLEQLSLQSCLKLSPSKKALRNPVTLSRPV